MTCFWCNCDPQAKMPNDISPHSTWCPHYRSPPAPKIKFDEITPKPITHMAPPER